MTTPSPNSNPPTEAAMAACNPEQVRWAINLICDKFRRWREPPVEMPAYSVMEDTVRTILSVSLANVEWERDALSEQVTGLKGLDIQNESIIAALRADLAAKGEALTQIFKWWDAKDGHLTTAFDLAVKHKMDGFRALSARASGNGGRG